MTRGEVDVLGDGAGLLDFDTEKARVASESVRSHHYSTKSEDAGLRECVQHLARLGIDRRQATLTAHSGKFAALLLALLQVLVDSLGTLDARTDLGRVRPKVPFDGAVSESLNGIPVFAATSLPQDRRTAEFKQGVLLEACQEIRVCGLDRQRQPSKCHRFSHSGYCPTKLFSVGQFSICSRGWQGRPSAHLEPEAAAVMVKGGNVFTDNVGRTTYLPGDGGDDDAA